MPGVKYMAKRYKLSDILDRNYTLIYEDSLKNPEDIPKRDTNLIYKNDSILEVDTGSNNNIIYINLPEKNKWWMIFNVEKITEIKHVRIYDRDGSFTDEYYVCFHSEESAPLYENEILAIRDRLKDIGRFDLLLKLNI